MSEELTPLESTGPAAPQPTLETIARLVEQSIVEQRETRARLDERHEITKLRFDALQKQLDGVDARERANFLALSGDLSDVRRDVATIEDHVGLLTTKAVEHGERFDQLEEHIGFLTTKVTGHDARFDAVDARFNAHDKRFDAVDERFDAVDKRFEEVDARFDAVETRFDAVDERFDAVDTRFEEVDKRFDAVDERFDAVDKRFEEVDARFDGIDTRLEGVDDRLDGIDGRLEGIDGRLDGIAELTAQILDAVLPSDEQTHGAQEPATPNADA